ncbi:serine hydrolase domain-containing protein [Leifsonia sp. NPDC058194]|uniref:serine hydrolase domain-containing protein n=1 Tax=Leifsonia sp. NPDC058194 TaxID=3346374 RepID=UPI0036DC2107
MVDGFVAPGWREVRDAFAGALGSEPDEGGSLSIRHHGEVVVDLWGGADPLSGSPWQRDTVTLGFSITKGAATVCLLQLVDRGLVGLDDRVAQHWPEFGAAGKEALTVRDVLTHRVGLPYIDLDPITGATDWDAVTSALAAQPSQYAPREWVVYHALSFGFLVGEIVRRVSGMPVGEYFATHVADPLGVDFWIGQPASADDRYLPSLTRLVEAPPRPPEPVGDVCEAAWRSAAQLPPIFARVDDRLGTEPFNQPEFRRAVIPAGNGVTNARGLATMYAACIGEVEGVRLLSDEIVRQAAENQAADAFLPDCVGGTPLPATWGLGFEISNPLNPMIGPGSFGHSGMGGRLGFAHPQTGVAFGFVSQRMLYPEGSLDPRWIPLLAAVEKTVGL